MIFEYNSFLQPGIEFELSSRCNARCPQCARNYHGINHTINEMPMVDISLDIIKKIPFERFKNLEYIRLCGTYGDPILNSELFSIIRYIKSSTNVRILISTNGGIKSISWWENLARILDKNDVVYFGIDGLKDTNHLYRIGVKFDKVIANIAAFNNAGGTSVWNFLVFKHNQHQIKACEQLAYDIKCSGFDVKKTSRFVTRDYQYIEQYPVYNQEGNMLYYLEQPTIHDYINQGYNDLTIKATKKKTSVMCTSRALYISAEGYIFPCGWLSDRMYGKHVKDGDDYIRLHQQINKLGKDKVSLEYSSYDDILFGEWFEYIVSTFHTNPFERCDMQCNQLRDLNAKATEGMLTL